jgi:hypothetical protein
MTTQVTITRETVPLSPQEAADRLARIVAILQDNRAYLISPLTPDEIPDKLEVNATALQEGER